MDYKNYLEKIGGVKAIILVLKINGYNPDELNNLNVKKSEKLYYFMKPILRKGLENCVVDEDDEKNALSRLYDNGGTLLGFWKYCTYTINPERANEHPIIRSMPHA